MASKSTSSEPIAILAMVLGWLVPGAGHFYVGQRVRGIIIFIVITATFWAGLAIGGTLAVDRRAEVWWFDAEMCCGVNGLIGWYRQDKFYSELDEAISKDPVYRKEMASGDHQRDGVLRQQVAQRIQAQQNMWLQQPNDTVSRAFCGVAGLLNLICTFDALMLAMMGAKGVTTAQPGEAGK